MDELGEELVRIVKENGMLNYLTARKDEISIRCIYCGDSTKSDLSAHLYIELDPPHRWYCQRCFSNGFINPSFLRDIEIYDTDFYVKVIKDNLKSRKMYKSSNKYLKNEKINISYLENKSEAMKLKYINDRLKINLSFEDALEYKIILNLKKFLEDNYININNLDDYHFNKLQLLQKHGVGFLSHNNSAINFRRIKDDVKLDRYYIHTLDELNLSKFYIKPCKIDLLALKHNIVICEGIFDLISIYENYYKNENNDNRIFIAVNGAAYHLIFNYLFKCGFLNLDIEIYSDNDVHMNYFKKIKNENILLKNFNRIKIYYNTLQKDFGVPFNEIERIYNFI